MIHDIYGQLNYKNITKIMTQDDKYKIQKYLRRTSNDSWNKVELKITMGRHVAR
jgi:hypothetical protein